LDDLGIIPARQTPPRSVNPRCGRRGSPVARGPCPCQYRSALSDVKNSRGMSPLLMRRSRRRLHSDGSATTAMTIGLPPFCGPKTNIARLSLRRQIYALFDHHYSSSWSSNTAPCARCLWATRDFNPKTTAEPRRRSPRRHTQSGHHGSAYSSSPRLSKPSIRASRSSRLARTISSVIRHPVR
jgi:hypothetical protein